TGARPRLGHFVDEAVDAARILRTRRTVRFRDENVAVGKHIEPARMIETGGEGIDREVASRRRMCASGPALGGGDLDRWDKGGVGREQGGIGADRRLLRQLGGIAASA